jgi:hypothetical protein
MHAFVTSYSGTSLVVNVDTVEGSGGPFTAWTINVGGLLTAQGALLEVNNLSDVANPATALTNIGGVPTSRSISAGTGLTGGGDLTANRTLTVSYGSTAGTACEGNDARLSDDRDPNLHAASHLPDGADEIFDQSLNTADSPTFQKITISGDEINGTAGAIHYRYSSEDPIVNEATPYFAVESYDQDTEERVGFAILGVRADKGFIQAQNADFRIEQVGGSLANINMANAVLKDANTDFIATIDVQGALSDDVTLTIPDQSGTLAVVTDIPTTAGDVGAAAAGAITTSGLTQSTARILGRTTASTGAVEEIQIGSGLSLSAGELSATGGSGGGEVRSDFVSPYTYTGLADAGTSESTASWTIRRSEYDSAGSHVATLTATATSWNNRLTASYS